MRSEPTGILLCMLLCSANSIEQCAQGESCAATGGLALLQQRRQQQKVALEFDQEDVGESLDPDTAAIEEERESTEECARLDQEYDSNSTEGASEQDNFIQADEDVEGDEFHYAPDTGLMHYDQTEHLSLADSHAHAHGESNPDVFPRVDSVSPSGGGLLGANRVVLTGVNLWPGNRAKNDLGEFTPPITICLQNQACDVDYFDSSSTKVVCKARPFNTTNPANEKLSDYQVKQQLTLSDNLCKQVESQVPGGHVFKKDEFVRTGSGFCDNVAVLIKRVMQSSSPQECMKIAAATPGAKSFSWRSNRYKGRQPCNIYDNNCFTPRGFRGSGKFWVYSLIPAIPAVFFKHKGEFVGGLVNQMWNNGSQCIQKPYMCGYDYDNAHAAKVLDVFPAIAAPGEKITLVGSFFEQNVALGGRVWLIPEKNQSAEPFFCRTVDDKGIAYPVKHTTVYHGKSKLSVFNCQVPVGIVTGKYHVSIVHDFFGEALPFKSLTVPARIDSIARKGSNIMLKGVNLDEAGGVDVGGSPCKSTGTASFHALTCAIDPKASWTNEQYFGGAGTLIETVRLGEAVAKEPESFADAVIMAAKQDVKPEVLHATSLAPPLAIDSAESHNIFYSRSKAMLVAPKDGKFRIELKNVPTEGYAMLSLTGVTDATTPSSATVSPLGETPCNESMTGNGQDYRGCQNMTINGFPCQRWSSNSPHKVNIRALPSKQKDDNDDHNYCRNANGVHHPWCYTTDPKKTWEYCRPVSPPSQVELKSIGNLASIQMTLKKGALMLVQLERAHVDVAKVAGVHIAMDEIDHRGRPTGKRHPVDDLLVRHYMVPQVGAANALCGSAEGCPLPKGDTVALLQTEPLPRPASPERARRVKDHTFSMQNLTSLKRRMPGIGLIANPGIKASFLQLEPVTVTTTEVHNGTCYWGPFTLMSDLPGCIPGDECKKYPNASEAQKACGKIGFPCGGIRGLGKKENNYTHWEVRSARWLESVMQGESMEKLACGKFHLRVEDAGAPGKPRGCALSGFQVEGEFGRSLSDCQKYCLQSSPRRPSGLLSTQWVEYHNDSYCGCFSTCEMTRRPENFASTADIYEFVSPDINTHEKVPYMNRYKNNPCLNKVCKFSDKSTWGPSGVPSRKDTDMIYIPENVTLLMDQSVFIRYWVVEGTMIFDRKDMLIQAEGIFVNGGTLRVGTAEKPFENKLTFEMFGHWHSFKIPVFGSKVIGATTGNIELYGKPIKTTWTELAETAKRGSKVLHVLGKGAGEWINGSRIVITATDWVEAGCDPDRNDLCQTEEAEVAFAESHPFSNTTVLHLKDKLKYRHLAQEIKGPRGEDMDIRAEVGLLSRNVRVIGSQDRDGTQHFGAQLMMLKIDKVALEYVEFNHVGQAHQLGRYPVHFHHSGLVKGRAHVRGCAIHRTFNRAVTNHATHGLLVEHNVAYNVQGHAFFFEDAVETDAIYRYNLGAMVRPSFSLLQVDMTPAVFWVTNPKNYLYGNHASGGQSFGFWFDIKNGPRGLSHGKGMTYSPKSAPLGLFQNNTAHSCGRSLWITNYDPRDDKGQRVVALFDKTKSWGNGNGVEALEVGHIWIHDHVSISDGKEAIAYAVSFADGWGSVKNDWNAPLVINSTVRSQSKLPAGLWTRCGVSGPTNDYVNVNGLHVVDSFRKGFFCGCKWCPTPHTGGIETRFKDTKFHSRGARRMNGWRSSFDSMIWDVDGSVSGLGKCHLHGCMIHPWIARGTGHLPKAHCSSHQVGVVCTSNVALRTLRIRNAQPYKTKFRAITIHSKDGASPAGFYMYDFRRGRQMGGMYHFTMASGITQEVSWNLGAQVRDIKGWSGELCSLRNRDDEYFLWSLKTIANPVTFSFNGKALSLNKMAKLGCPKQCKGCNEYIDGRNRCTTRFHTTHINCMGCRVPPNNHSNHRLLMVGHECKSRDVTLGEHTSLDKCAEACLKRKGCEYFVYGHGAKRSRCYQEKTTSEKCPEGYEPDAYDFYAVRRNTTDPPQMSGVDFLSLNKQPNSNGLWQYDSAVESFNYEKWRPGLFTGLMNAKGSKAPKPGRWGNFDGSDDDHPLSTWGSTSLQPCMSVSFGRGEGVVSACADEKDEKRFGMDVPPQTLRWCSDDWEKQEFKNIYMKTVFEKNDTMLIPGTWKVHFNCKKPVKVKILEIYDELIFEDGADRHLIATHIFLSYMGALRIGTADKPFANKATISLDGHRRTPMWPAGELMNKFIASSGLLELYGGSRPTWTRLAQAAAQGDKTIILEKDLQLEKGDEVLVTTTEVSPKFTERHRVASVKGTHVTLANSLAHAHDGLDSTLDGYSKTKGWMAAEVAVLRGNIVIEGLDTPGWGNVTALNQERWGANIKVFAVSAVCGAKQPVLRMEGVDLRYCGKDNTDCLNVATSDSSSYIRHCVVRHGLGTGMLGGGAGIAVTSNVELVGNMVYDVAQGAGIVSPGTVIGNLVTSSGYGFKLWNGRANLEDNVASGICCFAEFKQPGGVGAYVTAGSPGSWKNRRNVIRGATNAIILATAGGGVACQRTLPDKSAYPVVTGCGMLEHITIVHVGTYGIRASGGSALVKNMLFINVQKGVVLSGTGDDSSGHGASSHDKRLQVTDSSFFAKKGRCGGWGVAGAQFYNAWMRLHRPLRPPSFYGGTVVENVHFYGYGTCTAAFTNDGPGWVFSASDGSHYPFFTANLKFTGGESTRLVKFYNPGGCVQMACDGRRSSILTDTDGTLLGYKGTVLARNEMAFNYKLLPHTFRFDWNGSTIPQDTLYRGKGAYRNKDCKLDTHWNAWKCKDAMYRQVIIEPLDHDWRERRYAPVVVETTDDLSAPYGGFAALYTGAGTADTGTLQAFWTMAHIDMRHNIYFSSTNPLLTRVHLRDATPDQGVLLCIYYGLPNRVEVYRGYSKKRVFPMAEPTWDDQKMPQLKTSYPNGANVYDRIGLGKDRRPGYLYVVLKGSEPLELRVTKKIKLTKRLEVGEQEFVYKKGSQGLVRNLALLLNIPESRIKVVGLGRMMDGEIWGKHNGVANNYKPPDKEMGGRYSMLGTAPAKPELAEVIIDPVENENEDDAESNEHELLDVFANAENKCKDGSEIKCKGKPEIDSIPPPGWTCNVTKYNTDDGCDCDCGIWDPDCDTHFKWGYGKEVGTDGKIELFDTSRMETLLRTYDKIPKDHMIGAEDMMEVKRTLSPNNALRVLAKEMEDADDKYIPLLKIATKSNCGNEKACLMNPKQVLTKNALPTGVCVDHKIAKKGSACDANPCGVCGSSKCVADPKNSFGYSCVPSGTKVALASTKTGKFGEWMRVCFGRRRRKRCYWKFAPAAKKVGTGIYHYKFRGPCNSKTGKVIASAGRTPQLCMEAARKAKSQSLTWNAVSKVCTIYSEACNGRCCCRGRGCRRHWTYMLDDSIQTVLIKPVKQTGLFMLESDSAKGHCLKTDNLLTLPCNEDMALQHWQLEIPCSGKAMLKTPDGKKCMQAMSDTEFKMVDCDVHYGSQHFTSLALD